MPDRALPRKAAVLLGAALFVAPSSLLAEPAASPSTPAPPTAEAPAAQPPAPDPALTARETERASRQIELEETQRVLRASTEQKAKLRAEMDALRSDRARLNAALIDLNAQVKAAESRVDAIEERLTTLGQTSEAIRTSLERRRGIIGEVLAALQRMGRSPPPAVLIRPEDMLEAVRASMMLGAVLPELRSETEALAADLAEMLRLRDAAAAGRDSLRREVAGLAGDRQKLALLIGARQREVAAAEQVTREESEKAAALAGKAANLKDLIGQIEGEIAASARAAEAARKAAERAEAEARAAVDAQARETREKLAALAFKDPARLAPKVSFAETRGLLPLPVNGTLRQAFNSPDSAGGTLKGATYATRPGATVSAPCDGWVAFAGPFRSYGQLLIINAGGGYYLLLAGMERINVGLGQFVLAGEPVATMGDGSKTTATSVGSETTQPVLYIEFRKDGVSIDPSPWWATSTDEKVRG